MFFISGVIFKVKNFNNTIMGNDSKLVAGFTKAQSFHPSPHLDVE